MRVQRCFGKERFPIKAPILQPLGKVVWGHWLHFKIHGLSGPEIPPLGIHPTKTKEGIYKDPGAYSTS